MRRLLIIALLGSAISGGGQDIPAIRAALTAKEDLSYEARSRQLEKWYASFGHTIKIDHVREENGHYALGLLIATSPDLARLNPEAGTPKAWLKHFLKENNLTTIPFDFRRWNQEVNSAHLRYRMFKSFLADHPPIGRTKAEIEAILGPGSSRVPNRFNYSLGVSLGMGMEGLFIDFILRDGKVSDYRFTEP